MNILFIGNYQQGPGGEEADEVQIARELENIGHTVTRVNRDEWREYVIEAGPQNKYKIPENIKPDFILICKWHHFFDGQFIKYAKSKYNAPVFYWVWDWMNEEDWHIKMAQEADLYLSGELGSASIYKSKGIRFYYFQYDSCDRNFPPMFIKDVEKEYDVVFLGSCTNQNGRLDILKKINEQIPIQIFAYDHEEWKKQGFINALPPVYGLDFNRIIAKSRIVLGTSANVECFGYWSNRVGKVLHAGGFLLQWYTPGMESFLADSCEYFSTSEEAIEKIRYYLTHPEERMKFWETNMSLNRERWTSYFKVRQLSILMDRYKKDYNGDAWILP